MPSLNATIPLEAELLACCARATLTPETGSRVRELAREPLDWERLMAQAEEHSVLPLLARNLRAAAREVVPADWMERLETLAHENAKRCVALSAELVRTAQTLESRGIFAVPYKGPLTAVQAYGDITARQFEDLDFILRQCDIQAADAALRTIGYEPRFPWVHARGAEGFVPGEYAYSNAARQTNLELHTEATLRHFPVRPKLEELFARVVSIDLGGAAVRTFCPEDALVVLCVHGAKDFWQKLIWVTDVAALLAAYDRLDWQQVRGTAARLRAGRMLHLGLILARNFCGAKLTAETEARIEADAPAARLAAGIAARIMAAQPQGANTLERFRIRRDMVGGMVGWRYVMRLALSPAEQDKAIYLPLVPLYGAVRPFRLLRRYGWLRR